MIESNRRTRPPAENEVHTSCVRDDPRTLGEELPRRPRFRVSRCNRATGIGHDDARDVGRSALVWRVRLVFRACKQTQGNDVSIAQPEACDQIGRRYDFPPLARTQ